MDTYKLAFIVENCTFMVIIAYCIILTIMAKRNRESSHGTKDVIEKSELEQKKKLRAREIFANGYLPLRYEDGYFICSSLYPDGSSELGRMIEYKFPLESSEGDGLTVHLTSIKNEE